MTVSVACLVVTNRPAWRPWVLHQTYKQEGNISKRIVIVEDAGNIPTKRNRALEDALDCDYTAFFDDDDWSHRLRLHWATDAMEQNKAIDAVGNVRSFFVDSRDEWQSFKAHMPIEKAGSFRVLPYQAPEGIIFNGAVFRTSAIRGMGFDVGCSIGEDTEWLIRWMTTRRPNYTILGGPMQMWLCHEHNTTNRARERSFPESMRIGPLITAEEWALVPRG